MYHRANYSKQVLTPSIILAAPPVNLSYHYNQEDAGVIVEWSPSESLYIRHLSPLISSTITCRSDPKAQEHLVEVIVTVNITRTSVFGLNLRNSNYTCCVSADYGNYHPKACMFVSTVSEVMNNPLVTTTDHTMSPSRPTTSSTTPPSADSHGPVITIISAVLGTLNIILLAIIFGAAVYLSIKHKKSSQHKIRG